MPATDCRLDEVLDMTRKSIPKFTKKDLMSLPEGTWLMSNTVEPAPSNTSGNWVPSAIIQLPGLDDTILREELWFQYRDCISGRMMHCFDNELEMLHFYNNSGVES